MAKIANVGVFIRAEHTFKLAVGHVFTGKTSCCTFPGVLDSGIKGNELSAWYSPFPSSTKWWVYRFTA